MKTQKMVYTGPGSKGDERTLVVKESEVAALEKTGVWKKVTSKASSPVEADKGKDKGNG